jgi:broad specificity phosphatase PhoE
MKRLVIIVRHGAVEPRWKGICYGQQDVALCDQWIQQAACIVEPLAALRPMTIFHSGLVRTRWLAEQVAERLSFRDDRERAKTIVSDSRLRERHFGDWECKSWDDAYQSDPDHFHDLIAKPDTYRPPGGETTGEMQRRVVDWYQSLPKTEGVLLAVSHSGPIAAIAGHLLGLHASNWTDWMLATGEAMIIQSSLDGAEVRLTRGLSTSSV